MTTGRDRSQSTTTGFDESVELISSYLRDQGADQNVESLRRLEILLDRALDEANEGQLQVLDTHLQRLFEPGAEDDLGLQRLMTFLRRTRRTHVLSRCAELGEDIIAFGFPTHFGLFLDSLDLSKASMKKLSDICYRITPERIDTARQALVSEENILEPSRIKRLLALESREALPFASLITNLGETWVIEKVVLFLRKLDLLEAECAALRALEPSALTKQYVLSLCSCAYAGTTDKKLQEDSQLLLTQFIDASGDASKTHDRRIFAIRSLRHFPDEGTYHYLKDLATSGRLLRRSKQAKAIRDAAEETITLIGRPQ